MKWRIAPLEAAGLLIGLGINTGLLAFVATEVMSDAPAADKVDWKLSLSTPPGTAANRKPIDAYRQTWARPVFFKSREPFVPPPPPPPQAVIVPPPPIIVDPGLVISGVMIKNDIRKAYVFSRAGAAGAWTAEGDEFMGWKVKSINGAGARLEQMGRSIDLRLYPQE